MSASTRAISWLASLPALSLPVTGQQEDSRRAGEEVPLLTEIVAHDAIDANPEAAKAEKALAEDIERVLLVRLVPEVNKQIASLRSELEKGLRRSVRDAVEHALAERKAKPEKK